MGVAAVLVLVVGGGVVLVVRARRPVLTEREKIALNAAKATREVRRDFEKRQKARRADPLHLDNGSNTSAAARWGGGA